MPSCFVLKCKNSDRRHNANIRFHLIPQRQKVEWLRAIGRDENTFIIQQRVCSNHFVDDDYEKRNRSSKLKSTAVPTRNLPHKSPNIAQPSMSSSEDPLSDPLSFTAIEDDSPDMSLMPATYIEVESSVNDPPSPIVIDDDDDEDDNDNSQDIVVVSDSNMPSCSKSSVSPKPKTTSHCQPVERYNSAIKSEKILKNISYHCKYPGCKSICRRSVDDKRFFSFPSSQKPHNEWKKLCNIDESVNAKYFRICEDHFEEKWFLNSMHSRLSKFALPIPFNSKVETDTQMEIVEETVEKVQEERDPLNINIRCKCCYPHCKNFNENATLFTFPTDYDRHGKWKEILSIDNAVDASSFVICSDHFESCYFTDASKTALKTTAVPRPPTIARNIHKELCQQMKNLHNKLQNEKNRVELLHTLYMKNVFNDFIKKAKNVPIQFIIDRFSEDPVPKKDFTMIGKRKSLILYKKNLKLYLYLQHYFQLPEITDLEQLLTDFVFEPGINDRIFSVLETNVAKMAENDRYCTLSFMEMDLNPSFEYDFNEDRIYGYEHLGSVLINNTANKAVVFMLRGIGKQWKQIVAYYFISEKTTNLLYKNAIVSVIKKVQKIDLQLLAVICNYSERIHAVRTFLFEKKETLVIDEQEIAFFYDAKSLIKSTRNTLLNHTIKYEENKEINFKLVKEVVMLNRQQNCKLIKFTADDFEVSDDFFIAKAQLSHTVASLMETYHKANLLKTDASATIEFIDIIDKLFDSLNGYSESQLKKPNNLNPFVELLSPESSHASFWAEILAQINDWTLFYKGNKKCINKQFLDGFSITISSLLSIWNSMKFKTLNLRSFSLDPLENIMESVKCFYKKPTCREFRSALKIVILNNCPKYNVKDVFYFDEGNCEQLNNLEKCIVVPNSSNKIETQLLIDDLTKYKIECSNPSSHGLPLECCARFVLSRIENYIKRNSPDCLKCSTSTFKPYSNTPSLKMMNTIRCICDCMYTFLNNNGTIEEFAKKFKNYFTNQFGIVFCENHKIEDRILDVAVPYFIVKYLEKFLF